MAETTMGPVQELDIEGERFAYIEAGNPDAPLVLCAHGFPDHARSFEGLMARLASLGFRCVAPWLRGYAPSTLRGPYLMDRIARDLSNLAEALSPNRRAALIGHDWGAAATYFAIALHPERFCRAITMAVPHPAAFARNAPRLDGQLRRSAYMLLFQVPLLAQRALAKGDFAMVERLYSSWSPGYELDRTALAELKRCLGKSMPAPIGYYRALVRSGLSYRRALLELARTKITVPTLYLHGARDGCIGYGASKNQERYFKAEFRSELLSGVGHFLHLEDPERVETRITEWLAPIA